MVLMADPSRCKTPVEMISKGKEAYLSIEPGGIAGPHWKRLVVLVPPREVPPSYGYFRCALRLDKKMERMPERMNVSLWIASEREFRKETIASLKLVKFPVEIPLKSDGEK